MVVVRELGFCFWMTEGEGGGNGGRRTERATVGQLRLLRLGSLDYNSCL